MTRKQWGRMTLLMLLLAAGAIIGSVVLIDPFEIYHQATAFIPPLTYSMQTYSNPGIARNYEYDGIIIGSSMAENFRPSQLDELLGGRFVKLCVSGGSAYNHKRIMDVAFSTHSIARVLYGMDVDALTFFYTTATHQMPDYLYDEDLFNDVRYWFNRKVLSHCIPACLSTLGQTNPTQRDTMYAWGDRYTYGADAVLPQISFSRGAVQQEPPQAEPELSQASRLNVEYNILPFIEAHPQTEFIFFFPPYSLAKWYGCYSEGRLGYHLTQKEALVSRLLSYDNVRIYDFQAELAWITDLSNYIDTEHYGPWINDAMIEAISQDRYRVRTLADAQANDAVLREQAEALALAGAWIY